jgi:DNA-binding transcriptional ArsR family regulator
MNHLRLSVSELAKDEALGGAENGAHLFANAIPLLAASRHAGPVFLDFDGIALATASYLRESVLALRDYCRRNRPEVQVVVANACPVVLEELEFLLTRLRDAMTVCRLDQRGRASEPKVIGVLDEKQAVTLHAVLELGGADASTLTRKFKSEKITSTGWNNRLAGLADKGILIESRQGKSKLYRPIVEGLVYGT